MAVVTGVSVNNVPTEFHQDNTSWSSFLDVSGETPLYRPDYRSQYASALENDGGELVVKIPSAVKLPESATSIEFDSMTLNVLVEYKLFEPTYGIRFSVPNEKQSPLVYPYFYNDTQPQSARHWMPCIDRVHERCTWDIQCIMPRRPEKAGLTSPSLPQNVNGTHNQDDDLDIDEEDEDEDAAMDEDEDAMSTLDASNSRRFLHRLPEMMFIASGELVSHFVDPTHSDRKIVKYHIDTPISASSLLIAAGPFEVLEVTGGNSSEKMDEESEEEDEDAMEEDEKEEREKASRLAFFLPGLREDVQRSTGFISKDVQRVVEMDVNQPPLYPISTNNTATITNTQTSSSDTTPVFLSIDSLIDPLSSFQLNLEDEWASTRAEFLSLKSSLVLYMLDKRLSTNLFQKSINKILISSMSGELSQGLSTNNFWRVCRKVSGGKMDLRMFADQWVYGSGCPRFLIRFRFNRKKMMIEVVVRQENTNAGHVSATKKFTGPFMVRVHEPKGVTYDTEIQIDEIEKQHDILYHTKYKRAGQKLKKLKKLGFIKDGADDSNQNAFGDDDDGDEKDMGGDVVIHDQGTSSKGPDLDEFDRRSLDWIRWDPDNIWLCVKEYTQLRSMWIEQLSRDVDVIAQYEAIIALGTMPSDITGLALVKVLQDERYFYRIRMEAAMSLAKCGTESTLGAGLTKLKKVYMDTYCFPQAEGSEIIIPRPNDFSLLQEYYVKQAIPFAIARLKNSEGKIPQECKCFILNLLRFNDNSRNKMSDNYFISSLITSLGMAFTATEKRIEAPKPSGNSREYDGLVEEIDFAMDHHVEEEPVVEHESELAVENKRLFQEAYSEVLRYLALDRLIASHHNSITVSCLETMLRWTLSGLLPINIDYFLQYSRYGNYIRVRLIAIDSIMLLDGLYTLEINHYLLQIVKNDPDERIKYHIIKSIFSILSIASAASSSESQTVDEADRHDTGFREPQNCMQSEDSRWAAIKSRLAGDNVFLKLLQDILSSRTDYRVRHYMIRVCEMLYDPVVIAPPEKPPVIISLPVPTTEGQNESSSVDAANASVSKLEEEQTQSASAPLPKLILKVISQASPPPEQPKDSHSMSPLKAETGTAHFSQGVTDMAVDTDIPAIENPPIDDKFKFVALRALTRLKNHPLSAPFVLPVDDSIAPGYSAMIKKPMDISKVERLVASGNYKNSIELVFSDVRLIFSNCYLYNTDDSIVSKQAKKLEHFFITEVIPETLPHRQSSNVEKAGSAASLHSSVNPETTLASAGFTENTKKTSSGSLSEVMKQCRRVLKKLSNHPAAIWFLAPVDPIGQNIPNYFDVIKQPMDFSTIKQRISTGEVSTVDDFVKLVRLVFSNATTFNDNLSQVHKDALVLLSLFEKEIPTTLTNKDAKLPTPTSSDNKIPTDTHPDSKVKAEPRSTTSHVPSTPNPAWSSIMISSSPLWKKCHKILRKLQSDKHGAPFLMPVDPIALGIPQYLEIIKHPMDLSTVERKLNSFQYKTPDNFRSDVELMLHNSFTFNKPGDWVYAQGKGLQRAFWAEWKACGFGDIAVEDNSEEELGIEPGSPRAPMHTLLHKLKNHPDALIFLEPVDRALYPDYYEKIKRPIDLSTIQRKLDSNMYESIEQMRSDVNLMIQNCLLYNPKKSFGYKTGLSLQKFFQSL
ncbi:hypothetical protein HDV05_003391 [Chytridiales sp. JEL 0842]|nr:hypothetical protein HDV05_003391 [Chytridiales sp. JEL 0842]